MCSSLFCDGGKKKGGVTIAGACPIGGGSGEVKRVSRCGMGRGWLSHGEVFDWSHIERECRCDAETWQGTVA
jgi:hypothetical protein